MGVDTSLLKRFNALKKQNKAAEAKIDKNKAEMLSIEERLIEQFADEGIQNISMDGMITFIRRDIYSSVIDSGDEDVSRARACAALEQIGYGDLIKRRFDLRSLTKRLREDYIPDDMLFEEALKNLPQELSGIIQVGSKYTLQARKSAAKTARGKKAAMKKRK